MIRVPAVITQQGREVAAIVGDYVDVAVIVVVCGGESSPHDRVDEVRA